MIARWHCCLPSWRCRNGTGSSGQDSSGTKIVNSVVRVQELTVVIDVDMRTRYGFAVDRSVYTSSKCRGPPTWRDDRWFIDHRIDWPGNPLSLASFSSSNFAQAVINACEQLLKRLEPLKSSEPMKGRRPSQVTIQEL